LGLNLTHQGDTIFATWFGYDTDQRPLWLSGTAGKAGPGAYAGKLFRNSGQGFNAMPWDKSQVTATEVGIYALAFQDGNHGTLHYQFALGSTAVEQIKEITRQVYEDPGTICY